MLSSSGKSYAALHFHCHTYSYILSKFPQELYLFWNDENGYGMNDYDDDCDCVHDDVESWESFFKRFKFVCQALVLFILLLIPCRCCCCCSCCLLAWNCCWLTGCLVAWFVGKCTVICNLSFPCPCPTVFMLPTILFELSSVQYVSWL